MKHINEMKIQFPNKSANEGFARVAVAAFASQLDVTVEEISDIKTAVSEAVTNAIVHGYENLKGYITLECRISLDEIEIVVSDFGRGIADVEKARQPLYTSRPELERSGMGFTVMETFMDEVEVKSTLGLGTTITMRKKISADS
ncbi:MAG: anti-sigma F factor [Eubacteriales bacterium]|jgi:stage II sporulation protein AB (anti-sigma F factor)|nr:anti-sigma F factor [Eubacteriales bacterium]